MAPCIAEDRSLRLLHDSRQYAPHIVTHFYHSQNSYGIMKNNMDGREDNIDTLGQSNTTPEPTVSETSTEGGIFSGSDTRIETKNLPEAPQVTQQVPMSSISPAIRTASTVTGDLKLGNTTKKKKWPLVALGAAVIAMVGVGVWFFVGWPNILTPKEETTYGVTEDSKHFFNRYVNFLLEGNDSDSKPELIDFLANDYTFLSPEAMFAEKIKLGSDIEATKSYLNDLNTIYGEFSRTFFPPDDGAEEVIDTTEEYSRNALPDYFYEAAKGSYLNLNQIINLYLKEGEESVRSMLETIFKSGSENETIKSLLKARKRQMELYLDATAQADQDGCITDGVLNTSCANPRFVAVEGEAHRLKVSADNLETELRKEAIADLEDIYYAFYPNEFAIEGSTS